MLNMLSSHPGVSDYKINSRNKQSYEVFFVKGKLETVRCTDTCDKEVTVYADHDGCKGEAQFFVYPSTTDEEIAKLIDEAVHKANLIHNPVFSLPENEAEDYRIESDIENCAPSALAGILAQTVFEASTLPNGAINSLEIFINRYCDTVENSKGIRKSQTRHDIMIEAIPTYNGEKQSVELYAQYNLGSTSLFDLSCQIKEKMQEVSARYHATKPAVALECPVILNKQELSELFFGIAYDLNYASVYSHSNLYKKGDAIQKEPVHDRINISMSGEVPGNVRSAKFDADGISLGSVQIIKEGVAIAYFGSNRFGQYLGETPTGELRILCVEPGSLQEDAFVGGTFLEILSMSGLQVDAYSDYIGGEIRLAYYHHNGQTTPVTGVSFSGKLSDVLNNIRLANKTAMSGGYVGPHKAIIEQVTIF